MIIRTNVLAFWLLCFSFKFISREKQIFPLDIFDPFHKAGNRSYKFGKTESKEFMEKGFTRFAFDSLTATEDFTLGACEMGCSRARSWSLADVSKLHARLTGISNSICFDLPSHLNEGKSIGTHLIKWRWNISGYHFSHWKSNAERGKKKTSLNGMAKGLNRAPFSSPSRLSYPITTRIFP